MAKHSYVVDQILKSHKITEYLGNKNIHPVGNEVNGKLKYICPLHGDSAPSFIVFLNGEYENFFCFGCKRSNNIIHLYRDLEKVSTSDAIKALSNGLGLDLDAQINYVIKEVEEDKSVCPESSIGELALEISRALFDLLVAVENNTEDAESSENIFRLVDRCIETQDISGLMNISEYLPDVIVKRIRAFEEQKEKRILLASK
jgi:hypothetical protein